MVLCSCRGGCTLTCANGGYGFTSIGQAGRGQTGLLTEKERDGENAAMNTAEREFSLFIGTVCGFQPEHHPQIRHYGRTDLPCRFEKKKKERLRDEEKSSEEERK